MPRKLAGEREVSAQSTQPDRKESWRSPSSEGQKALVKPSALFSLDQGNLIRNSMFRNANPSNLRGSPLEGNKDHLLNHARSDTDLLNLDENMFGYKKNFLWKKVIRNTQIRNMHEMGEMKRAKEQQVE